MAKKAAVRALRKAREVSLEITGEVEGKEEGGEREVRAPLLLLLACPPSVPMLKPMPWA